MQRFKNILCIAGRSEGEESVLTRAAKLAIENKARLTLFDTIDAEDDSEFGDEAAFTLLSSFGVAGAEEDEIIEDRARARDALYRTYVRERRRELEDLCSALTAKHPGLRVTVDIQIGGLEISAIRAVLAEHHDLLIKAPEGSGDGHKKLFSSNDKKLIRKCPCPVWMMKPSRKPHFQRVLAAVDIDRSRSKKATLAKRILALATSLAEQGGGELFILHAWEWKNEYKFRARAITDETLESLSCDMQAAHQAEMDKFACHCAYGHSSLHVVKGPAEDVIPNFVDTHDIDLVVMGTVGRGGIPGLLIGNTAESVINSVNCSVLALKPDGFETPVKL